MAVLSNTSGRSIRNVAIPIEHGGWAFLYEPILLGLLLAPSVAGFVLGIAGLGSFLLYRPMQIVLKDRLKGMRYPRTTWAERFVVLYGMLAIGAFLLAVVIARSPFWLAILLAIPFTALQMLLVVHGRAREAITEISGAVALAALTPAILLANGGAVSYALALWLVPVFRACTSIPYIRVRLRRSRGEAANRTVPLAVQSIGILLLCATWIAGLLPITALIAMLMLTVRAIYGLFGASIATPTKQIGFQEIGWGLLIIAFVVVGR